VFAGGGKEIGLLPYEVDVGRRSQQFIRKQSQKGPCSVPWLVS
jgi:hypothetical protein